MTVSVPAQLVYDFNADGVTTTFSYPVRFLGSDELNVILIDGDGVETTQELTVDYTVSAGPWPSGGDVIFNSAPDSGLTVRIYRDTTWEQIVDLEDKTRNPAQAVENQLDRLTMAGQDVRRVARDFTLSLTELNNAVERAENAEDGAEESADAAASSALAASGSKENAETAKEGAETARDFAARWASDPEDGPPIDDGVNPPNQSAYHWAMKASENALGDMLKATYDPSSEEADAFAGPLNVKWRGAIGDGVTDDTAALSAAVAAAYAVGREVYWPAGTYLTTASIPNLHDVRHVGPGVIKRGTDLFSVQPRYNANNYLYVDASATDDEGDGISASEPVKTLPRVSAILANYGPVLQTRWFIGMAAGTYGGGIFTRKFMTLGPNGLVTIRGPEVPVAAGNTVEMFLGGTFGFATVGETLTGGTSGFTATVISRTEGRVRATIVSGSPEVGETVSGGTSGRSGPLIWVGGLPVVVISQSSDETKESGLVFGWHQQVSVENIRTSSFDGPGGGGVDARKFCDIRLVNFHDDLSGYGANFQEFVTYQMSGCCFKNNSNGILELFHVQRNIQGNPSISYLSSDSGFKSKEMTSGHMDDFIAFGAAQAGAEYNSGTTANVGGMQLYRCAAGVTGTGAGELHAETAIVWGTGSDKCTRKFVLSDNFLLLGKTGWADNVLTYRPAREPQNRFTDFSEHTVTGTTTAQNYALATLYANEHATKGQTVRVKAKGKRVTGSNGTAAFQLVMGGVVVSTVTLPTTSVVNSTFEVEFEVLCYADGDFQRFFGFGRQEGASGAITGEAQQADRTETWTDNDKALILRFTPGHASDSITINDIRMAA